MARARRGDHDNEPTLEAWWSEPEDVRDEQVRAARVHDVDVSLDGNDAGQIPNPRGDRAHAVPARHAGHLQPDDGHDTPILNSGTFPVSAQRLSVPCPKTARGATGLTFVATFVEPAVRCSSADS